MYTFIDFVYQVRSVVMMNRVFATVVIVFFFGIANVFGIGQGGTSEPDAPYTVSTMTESGSGQTFMTVSSPYLVEDVTATEFVTSFDEVQKSVTIHRTVILTFAEDLYTYITENIDQETYDKVVAEIDEIVNYAVANDVSIILILKQ